MTTTDYILKTPRSSNVNTAILRLERINKNLHSLRTKLSSYMCEPKTLSLYQRMESIKRHLDDMRSNNIELIANFQNSTLKSDQGRELVEQQFESYKNLEIKVLEYIGMAKMHC